MYRPSHLRDFLDSLGIQPKKSLGQHFLIDGNVIEKILTAAELHPKEYVLEIGPGPGSLTDALYKADASVIAVETDQRFAKALQKRYEKASNVKILQADILKLPLHDLFPNSKKGKVVANLPYQITSPILSKILPRNDLFKTVTVMVQEEVARRITAKPGTRNWNSLALFSEFYSEPKYLFKVSPNSFYPPPKVDSAVIQFTLTALKRVSNEERFFKLTRSAFGKRRKMLRSSLNDLYPRNLLEDVLTDLFENTLTRPEEISLEQFLTLFEQLENKMLQE